MYEYLVKNKNQDKKSTFENISNVYKYIDEKNNNVGKGVTNFLSILDIYKDFLISKYDLPNVLYQSGVETFFERLFDTLLGINIWEHFTKLNSLELCLDEIKTFIDIKFEWEYSVYPSMEGMFAYRLIKDWSRYGRYFKLVYLFLYKYSNDDQKFEKLYQFLILLNKLLFIYSICHRKTVYRMHSFMQNITKKIITDNFENLTQLVMPHIAVQNLESYTIQEFKEWTKNHLEGEIAHNPKTKNLVCRMSEYLLILTKNECKTDQKFRKNYTIEKVKRLLFEPEEPKYSIHIEHIHATADNSIQVEKELQNGIGNLAMLEGYINIGINNDNFLSKKDNYKKSQYPTIHCIMQKEQWTESEIKERRDKEVNEIICYLFPNS